MERRYKVGDRVDINIDNEILLVEIIGSFKGRKEWIYSVRLQGNELALIHQSQILEKPNE